MGGEGGLVVVFLLQGFLLLLQELSDPLPLPLLTMIRLIRRQFHLHLPTIPHIMHQVHQLQTQVKLFPCDPLHLVLVSGAEELLRVGKLDQFLCWNLEEVFVLYQGLCDDLSPWTGAIVWDR